jgi:hypothetical protein
LKKNSSLQRPAHVAMGPSGEPIVLEPDHSPAALTALARLLARHAAREWSSQP